eukprot:1355951-Lingulodinium_polyedra.AAC.1
MARSAWAARACLTGTEETVLETVEIIDGGAAGGGLPRGRAHLPEGTEHTRVGGGRGHCEQHDNEGDPSLSPALQAAVFLLFASSEAGASSSQNW